MADAGPRQLLARLLARFDTNVLSVALPGQPAIAVQPPTRAQQALWAPLQAWCVAGEGESAPLQSGLSVAVWRAEAGSPQDAVIEVFSRHLDGSHQLQAAGGALAGLLMRLRVKLCDVAWWRERQAWDPWDCGYVLNTPATLAALDRFVTRRATLMVAVDWPAADLLLALGRLAGVSARCAHPVRWLVVAHRPGDTEDRLRLAGLPVRRLQPPSAC